MNWLRNYLWLALLGTGLGCGSSGGSPNTGSDAGAVTGAGRAAAPATAGSSAGAGSRPITPVAGGGNTVAGRAAAGSGAAQAGSPAAASGGAPALAGSGAAGAGRDDADAGVPTGDAGADAGDQQRSTGPGDWVAGDYPQGISMPNFLEIKNLPGQNGNTRQYKVHVPPTYDPKVPMPVLFCIHGLGQDAVLFCVDGAGMPAESDASGFILVMPNGVENSWNSGTCCGGAVTAKLDEIGFFRAMFQEISKHLNIDLRRVYATGLSNGGYMSYRLACEASDLFVAVAPGAGAIGMDDIGGGTTTDGDFAACTPKTKISVLDLHGTQDPLIPYMLQKPSLERIAMANGCKTTTHPATQPASAGDTTCVSYDCPAGVDVTGCSVEGGGHVWFGSPNCGTGVDAACSIVGANSKTLKNTPEIWSFFKAHARD